MKIGIVGWGVEGQSAYRYFGPNHEYLIVSEEPRDDFPAESDKIKVQFVNSPRSPGLTGNVADISYLEGVKDCDKIVYTPVSRKTLEQLFPDDDSFWQKATSIQHIFFETVKSRNIIGVTGSKGKGTTSTLITKMLESAGKKVHLGGNIGRPLLDFVDEVNETDWVVLELANFQLYKFTYSPHIAVCLVITEEHMEWHPNMQDYKNAKANLFSHQTKEDIAIYLAGNEHSEEIAGTSPGIKIPYFEEPGAFVDETGTIGVGENKTPVVKTHELKLLGQHNWQNVCAAITAVWQVTQDVEAIKEVLVTFSGLEHRLEFVRELEHVGYYDDSFGTTPDTLEVAIKTFSQPVILIAGGHDKGADYDKMAAKIVADRVKHVIAVGQIADTLAQSLQKRGFKDITLGLKTMPEMVAEARRVASPGDVVLLSAGTSSFGLFRDYKDRGNQFKQAVQALA
jgi:UDP-N-acetylmuramoylalanine--D-glutamate ligase